MVQPLWKTKWQFLKKLKMELLYDPATPSLGIYSKEFKVGTSRHICTPMFITALVPILKRWKQTKYPLVDEWINKMWYIHTLKK